MEEEKTSFSKIVEVIGGLLVLTFISYLILVNYSDDIMNLIGRHPVASAIYFSGVVVCFLYSLISVTISAIKQTSIFSQNMKKIGLRTSWIYGNLKEIDTGFQDPTNFIGFIKKYFIVIFILLISAIFGSWLNIIFSLYFIIQFPFKYIGELMAPEDIKGARWRLKNVNLDFDGVLN